MWANVDMPENEGSEKKKRKAATHTAQLAERDGENLQRRDLVVAPELERFHHRKWRHPVAIEAFAVDEQDCGNPWWRRSRITQEMRSLGPVGIPCERLAETLLEDLAPPMQRQHELLGDFALPGLLLPVDRVKQCTPHAFEGVLC